MSNEPCGQTTDVSVTQLDNTSNGHCVKVKGNTLENCENNPVDIDPITTGVVAKIPVVLAELTLQVNVSSFIKLPESALEIKDINKKLKITQCRLLQNTNILFIKGFVRKNIDYSTRDCSNYKGVCGDLRHCTVDVPFECTTAVDFNGFDPADIVFNTKSQFEYFREDKLPGDFPEKERLLSGDFSEFNQITTEYLNEIPYCELISSRIIEFDEFLNRKPIYEPAPFEEKEFKKIEEKMVIYITLKILQKRQVEIGAL
ncbi:CsxC family protein [Wukongibacter sp. M2B1]|uniref:CsxC family protein n=1 Tax=Wukongibacter sp. M2B1 TaxID=3088895 RepID=UPI003D7AA503